MLPLISLTLGLSFLSGLNLYLATFLASVAVQQGWLDPSLHPAVAALGHPAVFVLSGVLLLTEFVMDKIPWIDSTWDAIHTIIRPVGAVMLSWVILNDAALTAEGITYLLAALGGVLALGTHLAKSGIRLLINTSPEPFTNILASLMEDIAVILLVLLLVHAPVTGFAVCLVLAAGTWIMLPRLARLVKTSVVLVWKNLTAGRAQRFARGGALPTALPLSQEVRLHALLKSGGTGQAANWVVPCMTGKARQVPGLLPNWSGVLVSPAEHPGTLVFLAHGWFRRGAVRVSLAGCSIRQETTMLSENLVIYQTRDGLHVVFRFPRAEAGLVATLVSDLRSRLGLEAPSLSSAASPGLPTPIQEQVGEVWNGPESLRH